MKLSLTSRRQVIVSPGGGTEAVLSVGTVFIPGAGAAGAGAKVASTGGKLSKVSKGGRVVSEVADFAVPGGSWALKGGAIVTSKLRDVASGLVPSSVTKFGAGGGSSHVNLIDAIDDLPSQVPGRHTPVSETMFGGDPASSVATGKSSGASADASTSTVDAPDAGAGDRVREPVGVGAGAAERAAPGQSVTSDVSGRAGAGRAGDGDSGAPVARDGNGAPDSGGPDAPRGDGGGASADAGESRPADALAGGGDNRGGADGRSGTAGGVGPTPERTPLADGPDWKDMSPDEVNARVSDIAEGTHTITADDVRAMPDDVKSRVLDGIDEAHGRPDGEQGMRDLRAEMDDPNSAVGEGLREAAARDAAKNPHWTMPDPDAPSASGLTNSGRLIDGVKLPEEITRLLDEGKLRIDDGILRLGEKVVIDFDSPALQRNPAEADRQLAQQSKGLSELTGERWLDNEHRYESGITRGTPDVHSKIRDQLKVRRIEQLESLGFDADSAKSMAGKEYGRKALLHSPDRLVGGDPLGLTGMGDRSINSALGAAWNQNRRWGLGAAVSDLLEDVPEEFWGDIRLDVHLNRVR